MFFLFCFVLVQQKNMVRKAETIGNWYANPNQQPLPLIKRKKETQKQNETQTIDFEDPAQQEQFIVTNFFFFDFV